MESKKNGRIIAAVHTEAELDIAIKSQVNIIFYLAPDLHTIKNLCERVHNAGKKLFVHMDLATGIGKDKSGMSFVKNVGVDGILSTRTSVIKTARDCGMFTVQRFFMIDSRSVETTVETLKASKADMMEIMPGVVAKAIKKLKSQVNVPIIAGGLIDSCAEIEEAINSGATAVSIGKKELWNL